MSWTPFKYRSMNWSEMLVELRRRRQLVFHPIAFSTSIQSLSNVKISKKTKLSANSLQYEVGLGHPDILDFCLKKWQSLTTATYLMIPCSPWFFEKTVTSTNYTPKAGAILRTPLEHTVCFKVLSSSNYNVKPMPITGGMSKTLKEIHYFFLIQGYEDIEPYIPCGSLIHNQRSSAFCCRDSARFSGLIKMC